MDIAGHVSRQMLARYTHVRMEAKGIALEGIARKPEPAPQAPRPTEEEKPTKAQPVQLNPHSAAPAPGSKRGRASCFSPVTVERWK